MKDYSVNLVVTPAMLAVCNFRKAARSARCWRPNGSVQSHLSGEVKKIDKLEYLKEKIRLARQRRNDDSHS